MQKNIDFFESEISPKQAMDQFVKEIHNDMTTGEEFANLLILMAQSFLAGGGTSVKQSEVARLSDKLFHTTAQLIKRGQELGEFCSGDPDEMAVFFYSTLHGLAMMKMMRKTTSRCLHPLSYVAVTDDRKVAGIAACTDGTVSSVKLNQKELRKHLGLYKGTLAGLFLKKEFEAPLEDPSPVKCTIDFVGTAPEFRGQGAAMVIPRHIMENTPYEQFPIEEVADTNIPAMKLYQKLGFQEYDRKPVPLKRAEKIGINHFISLRYEKSLKG
ncbi:GNAT family N-acetyltransferase [Brevibacillus fortis]|uniref:GNAT family N-acetyltransferase n=1 Tax=Brevibacillus fortis TaxID=2126352 RepID=UPI001FC9ABCA|nr:GNAT family N-acetyltransferase [Brevibacillus fortis]